MTWFQCKMLSPKTQKLVLAETLLPYAFWAHVLGATLPERKVSKFC